MYCPDIADKQLELIRSLAILVHTMAVDRLANAL